MGPKRARASIGTAAVLGLARCRMSVSPTTAYLMTYGEGGCTANCAFCPQARESSSDPSLLSRIKWPAYPLEQILEALSKKKNHFKRVCLQTLNHPRFFNEITQLLEEVGQVTHAPRSLCTPPLPRERSVELLNLGVDRVCFALDAATPSVFEKVKGNNVRGPYRWESHWEVLHEALEVFGSGRVTTHLIAGIGETEEELLGTTQRLRDLGVYPSLFAFTPIAGTKMAEHPRPQVSSYRRVQVGRYLIVEGLSRFEEMTFDKWGSLKNFGVDRAGLTRVLESGEPFQTSGCPGCNRPFYNENPRGPIYNYPKPLIDLEVKKVMSELEVEL
ncbi:MAG: radical SAM protein [Candidatus Bathyarchaeia archaeon]